ncbi:MAG: L-seryl-tRNA(Sec) selenium transferase [Anaerolineales bacterium]|nr:L-seryl-tRNA(Sec) selenium transferase [Anaerolineales bacterium]
MNLEALPSVDRVLQSDGCPKLIEEYGHLLTTDAIRTTLEAARAAIRKGEEPPEITALLSAVQAQLETWLKPTLLPVINATGVIIHTNLGRAPLSDAARRAVQEAAGGYCTLEFDLNRGKRGKREMHAENLLIRLTGAEAAFIVNNNASAVLLALTALAKRREVIIARSQLIEIGGGFRIPAVMKQSGAKLVEVGTTNRTHLSDIRDALNDHTALLLQVHHSNFKLVGFTQEPALKDMADLAHEHGIPMLNDLGSGTFLDTSRYGLVHEPTVSESLEAGADVVCFSGDKLLGGPQAGILLGRKELIGRMRRHPLARAVRPDKMCLAALSATLQHYLRGEALEKIPIWRMIAAEPSALEARARIWADRFKGEVRQGLSTVGGGSLPEETLPTYLLALAPQHANAFLGRLRQLNPPIIARVEQGRVLFDPRTILPEQEEDFLSALERSLTMQP